MNNETKVADSMPKQEKSEVEEQLDGFESVQDATFNLISSLSEKLKPVLKDCPNEEKGELPEPFLVPLANQLRSNVEKQQKINELIRSIIDRIEL